MRKTLEPTEGEKQRAAIGYALKLRGVSQAAVAIEAKTTQSMVSLVLAGERCSGDVTARVQAVVSRALKQDAAAIFRVQKGE